MIGFKADFYAAEGPSVNSFVLRRRPFTAGGLALLAGCTAPWDLPREMRSSYRFEPDQQTGAVVGSFEVFRAEAGSLPARCDLMLTNSAVAAPLVRDFRTPAASRAIRGPTMLGEADFSTPYPSTALVFAAVTPAVEHSFNSLFVTPALGGNRHLSINLPALRFTPRPGHVAYVGNIAVLVRAWAPRPALVLAVRDMSQRDLPRLRERLPWLREQRIESAVLSGPGWSNTVPAAAT